tara:strand:+ start:1418 stop:2389 length:972 start_codon:yes stop_codon:yes gene_type:complete
MRAASKLLGGAAGTAAGGSVDPTDVFAPVAYTGNGSTQSVTTGFDMSGEGGLTLIKTRNNAGGGEGVIIDTVRGATKRLRPHSNDTENTDTDGLTAFTSSGFTLGNDSGYNYNTGTYISLNWLKKEAFFDVVAYSGTGSVQTVPHSLGAGSPPEMMWVKDRGRTKNWAVYHAGLGNTHLIYLNSTNAAAADTLPWNNTSPTDSVFTVNTAGTVNSSSQNYIAYLFSSLAGVSKVGSAVHSGTTNVDAGFTNGSRFVMLKRTDAQGDWFIWNSTSGIVSGNDPYLLLNSTAAEVTNTDHIDPYSSGFTITSNFTAGTYIYYAIA